MFRLEFFYVKMFNIKIVRIFHIVRVYKNLLELYIQFEMLREGAKIFFLVLHVIACVTARTFFLNIFFHTINRFDWNAFMLKRKFKKE